jgi:hypothetical protein
MSTPENKPLKQSLKEIGDEIRMIIAWQLVDLVMKILPRNREGDAWIVAINAIAKQQLRERGVQV